MKRSEHKKRAFKPGGGIAVIGEGPTEQHYLLSLQGVLPVNVYPKVAKDGMEHLVARVEQCVAEGYDKVFCLIDMDNKDGAKERMAYSNFLQKYNGKKIKNRATSTVTEVIVIENHPCLEIWFYYYFKYTTGLYASYEKLNPLKPDLKKVLPEYEKHIEFFKKCGGLHSYLLSRGGNLETALRYSELSMGHHSEHPEGAFSQMCEFFRIVNGK